MCKCRHHSSFLEKSQDQGKSRRVEQASSTGGTLRTGIRRVTKGGVQKPLTKILKEIYEYRQKRGYPILKKREGVFNDAAVSSKKEGVKL